jgi:gliding motility-associated lipoprotein GldH
MATITKAKSTASFIITFLMPLYLGLYFLLLSGCSASIYDETKEIATASWSSKNPIAFDFEISDTARQYNIFLEVIHQTSFNYQNVYCLVESFGPQGLVQQQTNSLELASKKGTWLGQCSSDLCTRKIPFITRSKFDMPGSYTVKLTQHSRLDPLEGIKSIRLIIEPIQS